jgi:hypothetical protein
VKIIQGISRVINENATHNTFPMKSWILKLKYADVLWKCIVGCISNPGGSLSLVKYPVF